MAVHFAPLVEVGYSQVESLWQPLIWQERRMPDSCYVCAELMCSLPRAGASAGGRRSPAGIAVPNADAT